MMRLFDRSSSCESRPTRRGNSSVQTAVILGGIAVVCIGAINMLGSSTDGQLDKTAASLADPSALVGHFASGGGGGSGSGSGGSGGSGGSSGTGESGSGGSSGGGDAGSGGGSGSGGSGGSGSGGSGGSGGLCP